MWRLAEAGDDEVIARMCLALNQEDPGNTPVSRDQTLHTLEVLRKEPWRGRAVVAEIGGRIVGYALLIAFWSNEFGGEICVIDELYVEPDSRRQGLATSLVETIRDSDRLGWGRASAIALEVSRNNGVGRRFFEGRGFAGGNTALYLPRPSRRGGPG